VSQQIKRLELETKRPLFRRTTRSVALTDDGEMLLGDARHGQGWLRPILAIGVQVFVVR
jgi:DNA-binding transcriptional LysR family regulator